MLSSCYNMLGVPKSATKADVEHASRERARKCHPDRPGGSNKCFIDLTFCKALVLDHINDTRSEL